MILDAFLSPLVASVTALALVFLTISTILDTKRSRHRKFLRRLMTSYVTEKSAKRFSIMLELDRSVEAIWPILTHLTELGYPKLQVVVLVRHTAGKRALGELRRYQRANRSLNVSVIKHRKGMDRDTLLRRHAKGELVMWLGRDTRLNPSFLRRMSLEFLDPELDATTPRHAAPLSDSLASAARAWSVIVGDLLANLTNHTTAQPLVFRRSALLRGDITLIRRVNEASVLTPFPTKARWSDWLAPVGIVAILVLISFAAYIALPSSWYLISWAALGGVVIILWLHMTSFPYSLPSHVTLLLFLPFWPLIAATMLVRGWLRHSRHGIRRLRLPVRSTR